jgi:hypothetical protein
MTEKELLEALHSAEQVAEYIRKQLTEKGL